MNPIATVGGRRRPRPASGDGTVSSRADRLARWAAVALVWVFVWVPTTQVQGSTPTEYEVKAAYLYNFGRFVEWPPKSTPAGDTSFPICVLGHDPFGNTLDAALAGETIDGRTLIAKRILKPQDAENCRILFISSSEEGQLTEILATLDRSAVLTVSDIPQFVSRGGIIQFNLVENRVRFEINLTSAERAGLTMSSQLLKLATRVRKNQ